MADEDHDDDDPQLKSLRQVWLSMRDEDPPSSGLDALMAAAHSQAKMLAKPSWWHRLVDQLRRPPVLALATIVLLLGGVVVLTRHDDVLEKAPSAPPLQPLEDKPVDKPADNLRSTPVVEPEKKQKPVTVAPKPERALQQQPKADHFERTGASHPTTPKDSATGFSSATRGGAMLDGDVRPDAKKEEPATPKAASREPLVENLASQARASVKRGDCETARTLGARIAAQDATYYKEHVAADLEGCVELAH